MNTKAQLKAADLAGQAFKEEGGGVAPEILTRTAIGFAFLLSHAELNRPMFLGLLRALIVGGRVEMDDVIDAFGVKID